MKRPHKELPLFILWSDFVHWMLDHTEKFPRHVRFTLSGRIDNYILDIYEKIIEARYTRNRHGILKEIDLNLEKLRLLVRIAHDRKYISHGSYEYASKIIYESGSMLGGWIKANIKK